MTTRKVLETQAQAMGVRQTDLDHLWLHCFQESAAQRMMWPDQEVPEEGAQRFKDAIVRVAHGEPVAYVVGHEAFGPLVLRVSPEVLVPRPDSEIVVQAVLEHVPEAALLKVVDVGTGSGALAAWVAYERPHWEVWATDVSPDALRVAEANFKALQLRVRTQRMSWVADWPDGVWDVVISNPPYLASTDPHLSELTHEPQSALVSGPTGMEAYATLATEAWRVLKPGGWLFLEHGAQQQDALVCLLEQTGWQHKVRYHDGQGWPRCVAAQKNNAHRAG